MGRSGRGNTVFGLRLTTWIVAFIAITLLMWIDVMRGEGYGSWGETLLTKCLTGVVFLGPLIILSEIMIRKRGHFVRLSKWTVIVVLVTAGWLVYRDWPSVYLVTDGPSLSQYGNRFFYIDHFDEIHFNHQRFAEIVGQAVGVMLATGVTAELLLHRPEGTPAVPDYGVRPQIPKHRR